MRTANATLGFGGSGGTINLITKRPDSPVPLYTFEVGTAFQTRELGEGENFTKEAYASVEGKKGGFDYLFSATARDVGTQFDGDGDEIPDANTLANTESYGLHTSLGWTIDPERSLYLDVNYRRIQEDDDRTAAANAIAGEKKAEAVPNTDPFLNPWFDPLEALNVNLVYEQADVLGSAVELQTFFQRQEIETFNDFTVFGACCTLSRGDSKSTDERIGGRLDIKTPLPNGGSIVWGGDIVRNELDEPTFRIPM